MRLVLRFVSRLCRAVGWDYDCGEIGVAHDWSDWSESDIPVRECRLCTTEEARVPDSLWDEATKRAVV